MLTCGNVRRFGDKKGVPQARYLHISTHFFPFYIRAVEARKMRDNYTAIKDWGATSSLKIVSHQTSFPASFTPREM